MPNMYTEQDMALWRRYKQGDVQAKWALLDNMKGLIASYARQYSNVRPYSVVEAELKEIALKAVDTYNPRSNTKLNTHVVNSFHKISRENMANQHAIRLPENVHTMYRPIQEANTYLTDALNRDPTNQELADYTGLSLKKVTDAQNRFRSEMLESRQTYDPIRYMPDNSKAALFYAYNSLDNAGRYILEHTTGYGGKKEMPDSQIRRKLRMTSYRYNKAKNNVVGTVRDALHAAEEED